MTPHPGGAPTRLVSGLIQRLDKWLDRWFERRFQIRPIGDGGHIFRLGLITHRGLRLAFQDGTILEPGVLLGELHLDNTLAATLHTGGHPGLRFRREVLRALSALARDLETKPEYRTIPAVCGASLFWDEATFVGFEHRPLPAFTRWWLTWWERFLLARYHPAGKQRLAEGQRTELRQTWMTRRTLLTRYRRERKRDKHPVGNEVSDKIPGESPESGGPARASPGALY